jgi:hypothetical protein
MPAEKHFRQPELELAEALTDADRKNGLLSRSADCPSERELRKFVAGKSSLPDAVLAHLGDCPRCSQLLSALRVQTVRTRRISLALAATAVVVLAAWLTFVRSSPVPSGVATIDLREVSPTRGSESTARRLVTAVRRNGTVRILLPIGSEGRYECEIQSQSGGRPVISSSGEASLQDHDIVLNLPLNLAQLRSGRYFLGLRRNGSDWFYYSLQLE